MNDEERALPLINALVARADHAGHVILSEAEVDFALSTPGERWLTPVDATKRLYKLVAAAHERLGLTPKG